MAAAIMSPSGRDREWREVLRLWEKLDETQREEVVKLARALLEGHFKPGTRIKVDADPVSGTLVFSDGGKTIVTTANEERRDVRGTTQREPDEPVAAPAGGNGGTRLN